MTNKATPQIIEKANLIGRTTYQSGGSQTPAHSQNLNSLMSGLELKIGEGGVQIMKAFQTGWHKACDEHFGIK